MKKLIYLLPLIAAALFTQPVDAQSCNGRQATFTVPAARERAAVAVDTVRMAVAERPHPVRGVIDAVVERRAVAKEHRAEAHAARALPRAAGCNGGAATFQTVQTFKVVQTTVPAFAGCSGGAATFGMFGTTVVPGSVNNIAPPVVGAGPIQRLAVHRTLHKALRQGKLTPDELATITGRADLYDKAVDASTKIIARNHAAAPGTVGALGDGHILQMIINALPQIIDAVKQILALFALNDNAPMPTLDGWAPMPRGPMPRAVVPQVEVWLVA